MSEVWSSGREDALATLAMVGVTQTTRDVDRDQNFVSTPNPSNFHPTQLGPISFTQLPSPPPFLALVRHSAPPLPCLKSRSSPTKQSRFPVQAVATVPRGRTHSDADTPPVISVCVFRRTMPLRLFRKSKLANQRRLP
jgi:hypothetical protein